MNRTIVAIAPRPLKEQTQTHTANLCALVERVATLKPLMQKTYTTILAYLRLQSPLNPHRGISPTTLQE